MSIKNKASIVGAFEHPTRHAPDKTVAQLHAECAKGALEDAGLSLSDVDGYFCAGDAPGIGALSMVDYLGVKPRHVDSTDTGGSAYLIHVSHAAQAIASGKCDIALITLAGRPKSEGSSGAVPRNFGPNTPEEPYEVPYGLVTLNGYGMAAMRYMHQYGATSEQLAWVKVAASMHAQHNPNAAMRKVLTVEDVLTSPMVSDPLHRMDCCVVTDGGGALVLARPEIAKTLKQPQINLLGAGEAVRGQDGGRFDITRTASSISGPAAFAEAGLSPSDIRYASIYDSFTITVMLQLEDLGFCGRGEAGRLVMNAGLVAGNGSLTVNTDGGGLCNNHPANRGGITKVIEAVRQLRGQAHPAVQVPNLTFALANGTGGNIGIRHGSATLILGRV
jgi:acetyl-CoA C-acetyltransferase